MRTYAIYFLAICIVCISFKPINNSISLRKVYQYPCTSDFKLKTLQGLTLMLEKPAQIFYIDPCSDKTLYGNEGTVIFILPTCLRTSDSSTCEGKITIHPKEL